MGEPGGTGSPARGFGGRSSNVVRFRSFEVDFRTGELRKGNRRIRLRDKSLEVLAVLLEQPGGLVTREELRARLWPDDVFVDFENNINCAVSRLRFALGDSASTPRFIETLPRKGYRLLLTPGELSFSPDGSSSGLVKLLVLPFQNLGRQEEYDYLSDGVTEEIIARLASSGIDGLRVIARATAMTYKDTRKTVAHIGRELGVTYVVEGRLLYTGDSVRINSSIVHVPDGTQLWSTSGDGGFDRLLLMQSEVADRIAGHFRSLMCLEQQATSPAPPLTDRATYDHYLRGRSLCQQLTCTALNEAINYFRRAVTEDASYAPAWASLASCLSLLGLWGYAPRQEVMPDAERAARKAIDLDPQSALACSALGTVAWFYHWDFQTAEKEYLRSLELCPGDSMIRWPLFIFLSAVKEDHERAIREARVAEELDPASVLICANVGWVLYWARRYDEAVAQARKALEMSSDCLQAYYLLGASQLARSNFEEGIHAYEKALSYHQDNYSLASLAMAYGMAGARYRASELLEELRHRAESGFVASMCFAIACLGLQEEDLVFQWLERAYRERDTQLLFLRVTPAYDCLRSDPRFNQFLSLVGMPGR